MLPALMTNIKSRFDIDLKTVYKPMHISIATSKRRDSSVLSRQVGWRTDTMMVAVSQRSPNTGDGLASQGSHTQWHLEIPLSLVQISAFSHVSIRGPKRCTGKVGPVLTKPLFLQFYLSTPHSGVGSNDLIAKFRHFGNHFTWPFWNHLRPFPASYSHPPVTFMKDNHRPHAQVLTTCPSYVKHATRVPRSPHNNTVKHI